MLQVLLPFLGTILDKIFPDAQKSAEAKQKLIEMQINGELQALIGQLEINKAEAASGNTFAANWRPSVGYVCAAALAFSYLINPLLTWVAAFFPHAGIVPRPSASMITCGNSWRGCWALPGGARWTRSRGWLVMSCDFVVNYSVPRPSGTDSGGASFSKPCGRFRGI